MGRNQLKIPFFIFNTAVVFFTFVIYPIIDSIWVSFHDWSGVARYALNEDGTYKNFKWVGFQNYIDLFTYDDEFYVSLLNNLKWFIFSLLAIPLGLLLALFLNQNIFGMRYIKSFFYFPFVINAVVIGVIFSWFYNPKYGSLAYLLNIFGLDPIPVLSDEVLATTE